MGFRGVALLTASDVTLFALDRTLSHDLLPCRHGSFETSLERPGLWVVGIDLPGVDSCEETT